ncbi:glycosyltransferase family 2 protein, partial [Priestia megaterium]
MRDIQIFLVGYVNSSSIKKAVDSLHFINNRINEIIILDISETLLQSGMTFEDTKIQCINLINNDLGLTLNYYIHGLSCEYVMFLYSYDYLNDNVMKHTLTLNDKKGAMT